MSPDRGGIPPATDTPTGVPASAPLDAPATHSRDAGSHTAPHPDPLPPTRREQRAALARLIVVLAAGATAAVVTGTVRTVAVVLAIVVMIMLHEAGHFLTAKWAGMKVTEFFVGFGPRLWSVRKGETEYGVKAIPAGGYVKIIGMSNLEEVDPADEPRAYRQQPYWRRLSVAVAGSTVHFLLAFALLLVLFAAVGVPRYDQPQPEVGSLSRLASGPSPAEEAGFRVGDRFLAVDGRPVDDWEDLPPYIRARPGQRIEFEVERDGRRRVLSAVPVDLRQVEAEGLPIDPGSQPHGFVGIGPAPTIERVGPLAAIGRSASTLGEYVVGTGDVLRRLVTFEGIKSYGSQLTRGPGAATPTEDEPRFLSPVGFVRIAGQAADNGIRPVLFLLVGINVFVGVFNLIPLLPLDGGHVAVATYERLRSRRGKRHYADLTKIMPLYYMVFLVIVFLGVTSLWLDIVRPLENPFQ